MWHEARKQEKKIRGLMVDYKKRAERRREFYEKIKADPAQFVRVFGRPCKINLDPAVALAAESPQSMMPWQGDTTNMIDRFDVRAHLDILAEEKTYKIELTKEEEDEDRKANYERYRTLVENDSAGLTEEQCLQQIYLDEQFGAINKDNEEEKSRLKEKKVAIGYTYEDSTPAVTEKGSEDSSSEEEIEEDVETLDLDVTLDIDTLTTEQKSLINQCAEQYGMRKDDYTRLLKKDKDEQEALRLAKMLEEEKAQFAGRKSRRERRAYKEKRMAGRKFSPPSYAARNSPKYEPYRRSASRSRSRSKSYSRSRSRSKSPPKKSGRKLYITSFGVESDEEGGVVQGPALPPSGLPNTETDNKADNNKQAPACDAKAKAGVSKLSKISSPTSTHSRDRHTPKQVSRHSRSSSLSKRSRSRSRNRSSRMQPPSRRSRSRSRNRRSRSRSRSQQTWSRSRSKRSRSRSRTSRSHRSRSRSPRSRLRRSRSRSRPRRSRSWDHHRRNGNRGGHYDGRSLQRRSRSRSRSKRAYSSRSRSSSLSRSYSRSRSKSSSQSSRSSSRSRSRTKSRSPPPAQKLKTTPVKRYRRESLSSKSSESDEETVKSHYQQTKEANQTSAKPMVLVGKSPLLSQGKTKVTPQEKLKRKMQLALNKQYKADKKAEIIRQEKMVQERVDREEELRQRTLEMRRRERERRHREMEADHSFSDSSPIPSPRRRRRSPSPHRSPRRSPSDSPPPRKIQRSRRERSRQRSSRSRSPRSPEGSRLVSY